MNKLSLPLVLQQAHNLDKTFAIVDGQNISYQQFLTDTYCLSKNLKSSTAKNWALFERCTYRFAVGFFALLEATKNIVIPGDNKLATEEKLAHFTDASLGDFEGSKLSIDVYQNVTNCTFSTTEYSNSTVTIFTSGSTGEPKAICKHIHQLEAELSGLEQCFGQLAKNTVTFATVTHQHIYGLLFKLLWPSVCGRAFYSHQIIDFSEVFTLSANSEKSLIWVASPAHLKRVQDDAPWHIAQITWSAVFSSGGPLPFDSAQQLLKNTNMLPHEVYGSSETGGIAHRQQQNERQPWQTLPNVNIKKAEDGRLCIQSPHLPTNDWLQTDDGIELIENEQFILTGRLDRIIKLEEKRLSLVALEAAANLHDLVNESYAVVLEPQAGKIRQTLAIVCALTANGQEYLNKHSHTDLVKILKAFLLNHFERSLIPRKWRFVDQLPVNTQSKIDKQKITDLFNT